MNSLKQNLFINQFISLLINLFKTNSFVCKFEWFQVYQFNINVLFLNIGHLFVQMVSSVENDRTVLFNLRMGPQKLPSLRARVGLGVMAMKEQSTFPITPGWCDLFCLVS